MSAIRTLVASSLLGGVVSTVAFATSAASPTKTDDPVSIDERLLETVAETPTAAGLRAWHDLLGGEPHVAGSPGDAAVIAAIAGAFEGMGLETEIWRFEPLLSRPIAASLTFVEEASTAGSGDSESTADDTRPPKRRRRGVVSLPLRERELLADPATRHPELDWGWNAYSGSGLVEAGVVYANRGRPEDFARLRELGIDCAGRIVLVRYGGNYRGFKVRFAEAANAAGVVMFTDPADSGDDRGPTWPEGGWANETCIQRGSIVTLPYKGDPLTPFEPAIDGTKRLPVGDVDLPTIPVQPIGYAAANRIMAAMKGPLVDDEGWKGGLDVPYRLDGGDLELRLEVRQERLLMETANVFGIIRGREAPEEVVIVGGHHDAWGFGAADPLAGTIVLMETARAFATALEAGIRPRRTVVFAAWGAEEFGIIGSTEWCEAHRERLGADGVAYVNLDMAAMGTNFRASASPSLRDAVIRAADRVEQPGGDGTSVMETWRGDRPKPRPGDLGGGSDHVGFLCHLCIPSISLATRGAEGVVYHSNYDTLEWYRSNVGEDYAGALMLTRICGELVADLADAPVLPLRPTATIEDLAGRLDGIATAATEAGLRLDLEPIRAELADTAAALAAAEAALDGVEAEAARRRVNQGLRRLERVWSDGKGLPGRPWFQNLFATSNRDSGYGAVVLPLFQEAIVDRDQIALDAAANRYRTRIRALSAEARQLVEEANDG
ncbi:MAG: M28 family peptidase [Phycisphaerales bacterium]|nr:M28 family peptidase [Phycisphaerales bacterium]MDG1977817.1 M28 family peptidase [Phycisphaerales bacterium]